MRYFLVMCLCIFMLLSGVACVTPDQKPVDPKPADCSIEVTGMLPDGFADTTKPVITAALSSKCGNDIDTESIEILINDEAIPVEVIGSGSKLSVKHALDWNLAQNSDHYIMVRAKDEKGNKVEKEWSFYLGLIY